MNTPINSLLRQIYGEEIGISLSRDVEAMLRKFALSHPQSSQTASLSRPSEKDVILITYADHVFESGQSPLKTLAGFCETHLRNSFSAVHILPFFPWTSDDGFSVKDYYAVDPRYGSWDDIHRFRSFDLMFDAVFNHMSVQSDWFQKFLHDEMPFRNFFISVEGNPDLSQVVRPRALPLLTAFSAPQGIKQVWTTFSADQADLNFENPRVLLAIVDALLFYAAQGARFIRLDAIAFLWKKIGTTCLHLPQTHMVIQLMRAVLDCVAPQTMLITETNVPHSDNLSYFGDGKNEAQLVYNFALPPLVLHTIVKSNASALTHWASSLATSSPDTCFFNFLASHDGIGLNPVRGILSEKDIADLVRRTQEHQGFVSYKHNADGTQSPYELNITYFNALNDPSPQESLELQIDRFMLSQAMMLSLAGVPGVYFSSLIGAPNDRTAADTSGIARRINRQKFSLNDLELEFKHPASHQGRIFKKFQELLRVRRSNPAFHPQGHQKVLDLDCRIFGLIRSSPDGNQQVLCLHNVTSECIQISPSVVLDLKNAHLVSLFDQTDCPSEIILSPYQFIWSQVMAV